MRTDTECTTDRENYNLPAVWKGGGGGGEETHRGQKRENLANQATELRSRSKGTMRLLEKTKGGGGQASQIYKGSHIGMDLQIS